MSQVIYFKLGEQDRVTFGSMLQTMLDVKGLLSDFDAAVSRDPRGTLEWEVVVLEKKSPVVLGVLPRVAQRRQHSRPVPPSFPDRIEAEVIDSTAGLSFRAERTEMTSDSALLRYKKLAERSRKIGEITVYTDAQRVPINETTLTHIHKITGTKSKSYGSILGRLDTISVHRANEIRVWDDNTNKPVTCRYPDALEETIKPLLRRRVLVSGIIAYNEMGRATSVEVSKIDPYEVDELPTIEQVSGLLDNLTDGESLAKYLEHLRDG